MHLIQKQNHITCCLYFLDQLLHTLFKFTTVLGTGDHAGKIHGKYLLLFHAFRHQSAGNALCQTFDHCGLADTRLPYEARIVLGSSAEDLHQSANLLFSPNHRI